MGFLLNTKIVSITALFLCLCLLAGTVQSIEAPKQPTKKDYMKLSVEENIYIKGLGKQAEILLKMKPPRPKYLPGAKLGKIMCKGSVALAKANGDMSNKMTDNLKDIAKKISKLEKIGTFRTKAENEALENLKVESKTLEKMTPPSPSQVMSKAADKVNCEAPMEAAEEVYNTMMKIRATMLKEVADKIEKFWGMSNLVRSTKL